MAYKAINIFPAPTLSGTPQPRHDADYAIDPPVGNNSTEESELLKFFRELNEKTLEMNRETRDQMTALVTKWHDEMLVYMKRQETRWQVHKTKFCAVCSSTAYVSSYSKTVVFCRHFQSDGQRRQTRTNRSHSEAYATWTSSFFEQQTASAAARLGDGASRPQPQHLQRRDRYATTCNLPNSIFTLFALFKPVCFRSALRKVLSLKSSKI